MKQSAPAGGLVVSRAIAGYGNGRVLHGVDLEVAAGETAVLLGRNGVGKTTLMNCLCGWLGLMGGQVSWRGSRIDGLSPTRIHHHGVALVPQGRRIFAGLTVMENLGVARPGRRHSSLDQVFELFPRLYDRREQTGDTLSGGEQQMLSIGRALMCGPELLLLDEPSDGLAPKILGLLAGALRALAQESMSILLVEQNVSLGLALADTVHVMEKGVITHSLDGEETREAPHVIEGLLGLEKRPDPKRPHAEG